MGATRAARRSREEMLQLITQCRQSGLSDAEWCSQHSINVSTFYGWVSRLRKDACDLPSPSYGHAQTESPKQEVVRVEMLPDHPEPAVLQPQVSTADRNIDNSHTIEIEMNNIRIRLTNEADPSLLVQTLRALQGGTVC